MTRRDKRFACSAILACVSVFGMLILLLAEHLTVVNMILLTIASIVSAVIVPKGESIVAAAIQHKSIVYYVPRPGRHHHVCWFMSEQGLDPNTMREQGFMTNTGRFVDRIEACCIAKAAGQIKEKTPPENQLFSEDMW